MVDAKAVFDSIVATDVKVPVKESLVAILMAIRKQFANGMVAKIWWVTTNDMLTDASTKGSIAREPLLKALSAGKWLLAEQFKQGTTRSADFPSLE